MRKTDAEPWTILSSRAVYENNWLSLVEHQVVMPDGKPGLYAVMSPKRLAVGVVPFTADGRVVLVGQYRFPLKAYSWEIPEGGADPGEGPALTAARELREETGWIARHIEPFLELALSNSVTDERAIGFLAWDLEPGEADPDETEDLAVRAVPFEEALRMVMTGEITDAISVAALLKVAVLAQKGELPKALQKLVHL